MTAVTLTERQIYWLYKIMKSNPKVVHYTLISDSSSGIGPVFKVTFIDKAGERKTIDITDIGSW